MTEERREKSVKHTAFEIVDEFIPISRLSKIPPGEGCEFIGLSSLFYPLTFGL
jgi:hypothetical protein